MRIRKDPEDPKRLAGPELVILCAVNRLSSVPFLWWFKDSAFSVSSRLKPAVATYVCNLIKHFCSFLDENLNYPFIKLVFINKTFIKLEKSI